MATLVFQSYFGAGPTWTTLQNAGQLIGFYGAAYGDKVAVSAYQSSTHISGAGGDACTTNHTRNVKYIASGSFDSGSGTETLNDTNLVANECTIRIYLNHGSAVATQNGRFYCYNGASVSTYATDIQVFAFEQGVSATAWTSINNGSSSGGDNSGQRLDIANKTAATDNYWYIGISCSPLSVGAKTAYAFGSSLEYY
jgi:hypothetical protein